MANFNLSDYETVDSRIKRFYTDHPSGRITTDLVAYEGEVNKTRWIVKASVFRAECDQETCIAAPLPDGTGYAFELDGTGMANKTAALENAETSAIGRALANIGYSGDKRASREEMQKATAPAPDREAAIKDWLERIPEIPTVAQLQASWELMGRDGITGDPRIVDAKDARKKALS